MKLVVLRPMEPIDPKATIIMQAILLRKHAASRAAEVRVQVGFVTTGCFLGVMLPFRELLMKFAPGITRAT